MRAGFPNNSVLLIPFPQPMSFFLSKILWALASPGSLLAFLLVLGLGFARFAEAGALKNRGRGLCSFAALCFLALAIFPVGEWALIPLENRFPASLPESADGILLLGGDEQTEITQARGTPTSYDSLRRYAAFTTLARRYPDARLVFSGGSGALRPTSGVLDSDIARALLTDMGAPTDRLLIEKTSRNTWENATRTSDLIRPQKTENWILVTSPWHMSRAMGCFRKAGWHVTPAPAGYFTTGQYRLTPVFAFDTQLHLLTLAVHEYIGLVAYKVMGRSDSLWPAP